MHFNMFKKRDYSLVKSIEYIDMTLSGSSRNIRYQLNLLSDRPRIIEVKYICDVEHFLYAYHCVTHIPHLQYICVRCVKSLFI